MSKVPLYDGEHCIGLVNYTSNLDHWDGGDMTSGSPGNHLGIGKTRTGKYYLVHGTQWQGERDTAEVISKEEAQELVMRAADPDLYKRLFGEPIPELD